MYIDYTNTTSTSVNKRRVDRLGWRSCRKINRCTTLLMNIMMDFFGWFLCDVFYPSKIRKICSPYYPLFPKFYFIECVSTISFLWIISVQEQELVTPLTFDFINLKREFWIVNHLITLTLRSDQYLNGCVI